MRVWLITGASRGMGASFVRAALAAGDRVVATARRPEDVSAAFDASHNLLAVRLDVTSVEKSAVAVNDAVDRFGRIDVVVNSAGASFKGFFEEMSPQRASLETRCVRLSAPSVNASFDWFTEPITARRVRGPARSLPNVDGRSEFHSQAPESHASLRTT